jgi:peptide/nickel transport system substrate-binding protein
MTNPTSRRFRLLLAIIAAGLLLAACAQPTPMVIEKEVIKEVEVEKPVIIKEEVVKEVPVEKEVIKEVEVEKVVEKKVEVEKLVEVEKVSAKQAPMLQELVKAGKLPDVDERLPLEPQVVEPVESIGQYGGTWHAVDEDVAGLGRIKMTLYDPQIRWKPDYTGYEAGQARDWKFSDGGKTVTLYFRKGVKWSDGEPFTMDDMKFWWEDMAKNPDYMVVQIPWWGFKTDGSPMDVEFPDDYTMIMKWDAPHWITPFTLAQGFWEGMDHFKPKHYLQQFHPTYTANATYEDLELADRYWDTPGFPCLWAWCCADVTPGERVKFERNPYYWKVDTQGNQLPYIDYLEVDLVEERETRLLQLSQGNYDIDFRGSNNPLDMPFLLEQAAAGDYHLQKGWMNGAGGWPCWLINQDYTEGDEIRDLLRDVNFRKGISVAMDRDRIVAVAWGGIGTAQQSTISPQSWHFESSEGQRVFQEWAAADAEYDPDLAVEYFEKANFTDQDGDGFRDLPSGKPLTLIIDVTGWAREEVGTPASETFKGNLEAVGVRVGPLNIVAGTPESDLRQVEGTYMLRTCHASEVDIWTYPDWIFPLRDNRAWPMQGKWRQTGGAEGWEPEPGSPAAVLQELYDAGLAEPDEEKRHEIVWEAVRVHIEEGPFTLGAAGDQPMPVIVKNNVRNVPEFGILGPWAPGSPGNTHPEQYWIEQ